MQVCHESKSPEVPHKKKTDFGWLGKSCARSEEKGKEKVTLQHIHV